MTSIVTGTYGSPCELLDYHADLQPIPPSSNKEQRALLHEARQALQTAHAQNARNRLVEAHLRLATHVAIRTCPATFQHLLPDIIGEVNLVLVQATTRYLARTGEDITAYLIAHVIGTVKNAISERRLIRIPSTTLSQAKKRGIEQSLYALEPMSLQVYMARPDADESGESRERFVMPVLPTEAAPTRDPGQCFLVEQYLSMLPARAQRVLRLRYGLSEENEHPHTTTEIATLLEITSKDVLAIERSAYKRLRKLASGEGKQRRSIHVRKGESYAVRARGYQERIATVYPRMAANGPVNGKHLSKEAHVPERVAYAYLHSRKGDA